MQRHQRGVSPFREKAGGIAVKRRTGQTETETQTAGAEQNHNESHRRVHHYAASERQLRQRIYQQSDPQQMLEVNTFRQ